MSAKVIIVRKNISEKVIGQQKYGGEYYWSAKSLVTCTEISRFLKIGKNC